MNIYNVIIKLHFEQKNINNNNVVTSKDMVEFFHNGTFMDISYEIEGNNNDYYLRFSNIKSKSEEECYRVIDKVASELLKLASLILQENHSNQHSTHWRFSYYSSDIKVKFINKNEIVTQKTNDNHSSIEIEEKFNFREKLSITSKIKIDMSKLDKYKESLNNRDFNFMINCYYRAIASTDYITKYYNAFSTVEFIEKKYSNKIKTSKLLDDEKIDEIIEKTRNIISDDKNLKVRICNRITSSLRSATLENRATKLLMILNNIFGITCVKKGAIEYHINAKKLKEFINLRNELFHGRKIKSDNKKVRELSIELIALLELVLSDWNE